MNCWISSSFCCSFALCGIQNPTKDELDAETSFCCWFCGFYKRKWVKLHRQQEEESSKMSSGTKKRSWNWDWIWQKHRMHKSDVTMWRWLCCQSYRFWYKSSWIFLARNYHGKGKNVEEKLIGYVLKGKFSSYVRRTTESSSTKNISVSQKAKAKMSYDNDEGAKTLIYGHVSQWKLNLCLKERKSIDFPLIHEKSFFCVSFKRAS